MQLKNASKDIQEKILSCILTFDYDMGEAMCTELELYNITSWNPTQLSEIIEVILLFNDYEIPIKIVLDSCIWSKYITSIVSDLGSKLLAHLGQFRDKLNELLIMRACYRYNTPIIDDNSYDTLFNLYTSIYPNTAFLRKQAYDDDTYDGILKDILIKNGILQKKIITDSKYAKTLRGAKTTSILPLETYEETFEFIHNSDSDILFSLKIDGMNAKTGYIDNKFELGLSRGRSSDGFDYSEALKQIIPMEIQDTYGFVTITGEVYIRLSSLKKLNAKYIGKDLKTPKSAAGSMLVAPEKYDSEDFEGLKFIAHGGENIGNAITDKYTMLLKNNFEVPPHISVSYSDIPKDIAEFKLWLKGNILDILWKKGEELEMPSDGVVCEKIQVELGERKDQYSDANIAIKYEQWKSIEYKGIVEKIIFEQKRVNASVVLQISPVITKDFNIARRVSVGSPNILIEHKILPGKEITFVRKSQAINVLVTD